jgi:predicted kinase
MTLLEYVASLQDQGLSSEEIFAKAQEFKEKNKTEEVEVKTIEAPEVKEVKIEGVAETTDATVPPKTPDASETPFSDAIYGDGDSQYQEGDFNKIHENVFGKSIKEFEKQQKKYRQDQINSILKEHEPGTPERTIAYYQLELAPDETINKDLYSAYDKYQNEKKEGEQFSDFFTRIQQEALEVAEKQRKEKIAKMTTAEQAEAVFINNIPIQLEQAWEGTKAAFTNWISSVAGKDAADFLVGKMPDESIVFVDPETNEEVDFSENPEKWKKLNTRNMGTEEIKTKYKGTDINVGKFAEDYIIERFKESEELGKGIIDVGNIVDKFDLEDGVDIKFTSGRELFGGILNAVGSTVSTVIPAALTRGASLFPQVAAPMYVDYNVQKAKSLYGDTPDAIDKLVQNNEVEVVTPLALGGIAVGLEYVGFKGIMKNLIGKTGLLKPLTTMVLTQNKEGLTEVGQAVTEKVNEGLGKGKSVTVALTDAITDPRNAKEYLENYMMGVIGSGVMTAPTSLGRSVNSALITETEVFNNATKLIQEVSSLQLQKSQSGNKAFKEAIDLQIQEKEQSLKDLLENTNKLTNLMTKEEQNEVLDLLNQKKKNNETLIELNESLSKGKITAQQYGSAKGGVSSSNKALTNKVDRVLANANKRLIEGEVAIVEDLAGKENVQTFDTIDEFVEATGQDGEVDAFINEIGKIFINKQRAAEVGAITAGSHELLHRILRSTFQADTNAALKLVDSFKNILSEKEKAVVDKRIEENYKDATAEVKAEEYLTAFSDAIGKGEITYKDNLKETFMRLAKPILDIFRPKGYSKLNFESGRDVYNFIKDYQKNIKKGKISERAQKLQELEEVDLGIIKKSVTNREIASNEVQKIYEDQGVSGAMDIIQKFKPITNRIVEARSQAPNFDRQLLTDEIETGPRGILDLIMEYKQESGVPLAAYINKFLPARAIEASRRVLGEEFTADVTEAKGVVAEETAETVAEEKPIAKKPTETVEFSQAQVEKIGAKDKTEVETRITKAANEAFKGQDIKTFGQTRNVPKAVADIYAGMFGLNPQTITDKTRNYQKTDAEGLTTAKQFLLKNANNDFARLPETKDGFGKGTFLPRNVMNALYTDGKLTGTLKDYMDLIRQKPVKPIYRDAVGQTIRGLLNLHIRNRMFEDLVTTTPERLRGGAKFSKTTAYQNLFQALPFERVKDDFSTLNNFRWGAILQATLKGSGVSPIDMKTREGRQRFKDYAVSSGMISKFPKDFWRSMQGTTENLLKDKTKKFGEAVKETREFVESLAKDPDVVIDESQFREFKGNLPFKSVKEVNEWIAETEANGGVFAEDSQLFSDMLKKENPTAKRLPMEKALNDPAFIKRQENSINGLKKVFEIFQDAMKTPEGIAFVAAIMSSSGASQNHFIRKSAPWKFYQKGYLDQAIREEHTLPASLIGKYLFMSALGGTVSSDFKNVKKNFFQGALLKTNDDRLKGFKPTGGRYDYVESTPEGWKITDNIWARYFNINVANTEGGINPQSIMLANNKSVFDLFNVTPSGLKLNEQGVKDLPKVEKALDEVVPKSMYSKTIPSAQQNIYNQGILDSALNKARRPDAPVKKIRVFDFDDTLARSKSQVLYTVPNVEGGFSEGATNLKAIFMVGGPGAGKTNVGKGLQLGRRGYKVVNQDIALEAMKEEAGLPAKESDYTAEQRSTRSKLGAAARKAAVAKFDKYASAGNGMVIDGTGASYNATTKKIKALEDAGFEVHMVVATTPLETAIERNRARTERSLPDFVVEKTYESVQESLKKYREDFGDRLYEINTETIEYGKPLPNEFLQKVYNGINRNKVGKVDASNFATEYDVLESQGAEFDFREFSRVIEGEKGPLFSVAKKIAAARGTDDIFILTARPADAAKPIQEFMKANGIDIPLQNITGLGDGTAAAKGRWIASKAAEGYNDFYFADDAIKNVQAVKDVLSQVDVKSKVQQAKFSKTKTFDKVFNDIIEQKTGIESYKQFSAAKAKTVGANKGKFTFFTTPSAEDFLGLLYKTLGKGKIGDAQMAFYKENLLDPFNRAEMAISQAKVAAGRDYKALKKQFKNIPKTLEKETGISKYSYQHAIRTYIWDSQGLEVPGLSKRDQKRLTDFIKADPELQAFADQLITIQKGKPYPKPDKDWTAGNITTDVISGINKVNRAEYLQEWQENVDIIFSKKNMNKLEAAFGAKYVEALKDSLRAMKSGSNRPLGGDRVSNEILDWLNNSVGAIMFLNTRSAVLQTISAVNFINWGDNNILKAGKAFANQKQFWGDFLTLMNSDYLLERRDGLKINVSESEIADAVEGSKNKVNAAISYLLNKGFVFTRYADSFAIASGGATFYRNRIESLVEQGMDRKLAEQQAFEDFRLIAEENQQSSSPMRISQQQRSLIGRIVLQFGNTQLQYVRIQKRAVQDLVDGRGDWRANISKIVYYGAIQNLLFNALQSGLAWAMFDDDEDDEELTEANKEQKLERALNGAIDSQLKGLGIQGAVIAGVKNALLTIAEQTDKKSPKFEEALDDLLSIAPALGSKIRKLKSAARTVSWNGKEIKEKGFSMDNPAYLAGAQTISAVFNIPLDRAVMKMNNMRNILNPATENWQKVALALGWSTWDIGLPYFGLAEDKPVLTETEKQTKKLFDLNKSDQVKMLLDLGLTKKEIRALTKEDQRVDQIIKLQNKKKDGK